MKLSPGKKAYNPNVLFRATKTFSISSKEITCNIAEVRGERGYFIISINEPGMHPSIVRMFFSSAGNWKIIGEGVSPDLGKTLAKEMTDLCNTCR